MAAHSVTTPNGVHEALCSDIVAVQASNPSIVPQILEKVASFGPRPFIIDDDIRLELAQLARTLYVALKTPREMMIEDNWVQPGCHAAITACHNAGVFKVLSDTPIHVSKITQTLGLSPAADDTFARMLRHLAARGCIKETGSDEYVSTNFSKALTIPTIGDGYSVLASGGHLACSKLAEYLQHRKYELKYDTDQGPYQYTFQTDKNMFRYLQDHPPLGMQMDNHMSGYRQGRPSWMDSGFYPVERNLIEGISHSKDAVLLVDIGGGHGRDLQEFKTKYPTAPGRLVVQDLPLVIDGIEQLDASIERMKHDFHTEQPLKGARAYYVHSVLHDWPNEMCMSILKRIVDAMKPGYSKLLINEIVLPDRNADAETTGLDMMLMALFTSKERKLQEWTQLIEASGLGLKIVSVWSVKHSQESLIECELA